MSELPQDVDAEMQAGLERGVLLFPRCRACALAWLPPRTECPRCLVAEWAWEEARGEARLISWVVYHRAYHESFADRVPYNVALVELVEGPRLISTLVGDGPWAAEMPLRLALERHEGRAVACFRPAPDGRREASP